MKRVASPQIKYICAPVRKVLPGGEFSGNAAALKAGRRLADPRDVEQAVLRAALEFMAGDRAAAASARMRAAVVPFLSAAGGAL